MGGEAGVHKETFFSIPFFKPSVVEQFQVVLDDERHNVMLQALLKKEQATYTAISVLEGMNAFKSHIEGHNVLKSLRRQRVIVCQQFAHLTSNFFGECGVITAYLVGQFLIVTNGKPILATIAGAGLQYEMQFLDKFFCQG